ncbi:bifunctional 23S rRNA (guanine(2069)-N(7))-methyltransferase RlmK/23S rRNA (guanine(2445)-N(2))-methyltransferase RlmL [Marinobacterium sediminicola]|uniref:Ribosomal RNA large subunit methyltransferase K/L n=1 Tax=Marinobacterium sediminicola TaxID=518898 RepID=A0ABY1RWU9_9GAMM|nr:bifunctional 23S rRNA (guanine(2069)-N(7))-methyltransferase RlmK/23S rRNA (guanine(2445)-N(2))-methyltransferase RlmL [Marinobacterium sediminicola]ULG67949.1 bifunctional 23S rRNA (guanine(2069)-N(7))-methyltransferase RlmK/23S rRNA (guanine(2445)-N(2))-methyltransferase RlmL [Marinobacterium sediminicola]SMR71316.1 23S rRNA m(2)G-2445 methyltransferase [Marinobacterium sediminicola]
MKLFITCPKGLENLLQDEIERLGGQNTRQTVAGVYTEGELELAYRICLWSRLGNRVLMPVAEGDVEEADALYALVQQVDWLAHLRPSGTLTVDFNGRSRAINNTHFGALKVKDAIVDQIRTATGQRPTVERNQPDLRINVHLHRGKAVVALDLSGESLHRRGYRLKAGAAPMKENLAAAVLARSGWPFASSEAPLVDPMCGSGTLLIEAALMAADIAPGLFRQRFGFSRWLGHDGRVWTALLEEARERREQGLADLLAVYFGFDADETVLERARENARRAGVADYIRFVRRPLEQLVSPGNDVPGLLVTNPPYGERLGEASSLMFLYRTLGDRLRVGFTGWEAAVFTANPELCKVMKLRADKQYRMFNGALDSKLLLFKVHERDESEQKAPETEAATGLSEQAQMFANRLKKNLKQLARWVKREQISCYRVYDADMPEYAVAIDVYPGHAVVQEYAPPAKVDPVKAFSRLQDVMQAVPVVLELPAERVVLKQRKRQQGQQQYERQDQTGHFMEIIEHGCRLQVNLHDYLDTGLFLDHRPVRHRLQQLAQGKDVLNLFCYTATASVHAGVGGAATTTSVDMSATYLEWARRNMELNGLPKARHKLVQSDCFKWLEQPHAERYDLIFMDPPTFSNSKRMQDVLDVQRDHVRLIEGAMQLLRKDGLLIFSNNYRRFVIDREALSAFDIKDITPQTLDPDFKRNAKIHCCFEIRHGS